MDLIFEVYPSCTWLLEKEGDYVCESKAESIPKKTQVFMTLVVFQGRGRQTPQGLRAPRLPATRDSLNAIHKREANKGKKQERRQQLCYF